MDTKKKTVNILGELFLICYDGTVWQMVVLQDGQWPNDFFSPFPGLNGSGALKMDRKFVVSRETSLAVLSAGAEFAFS